MPHQQAEEIDRGNTVKVFLGEGALQDTRHFFPRSASPYLGLPQCGGIDLTDELMGDPNGVFLEGGPILTEDARLVQRRAVVAVAVVPLRGGVLGVLAPVVAEYLGLKKGQNEPRTGYAAHPPSSLLPTDEGSKLQQDKRRLRCWCW